MNCPLAGFVPYKVLPSPLGDLKEEWSEAGLGYLDLTPSSAKSLGYQDGLHLELAQIKR
jgi:hypothetical protein